MPTMDTEAFPLRKTMMTTRNHPALPLGNPASLGLAEESLERVAEAVSRERSATPADPPTSSLLRGKSGGGGSGGKGGKSGFLEAATQLFAFF